MPTVSFYDNGKAGDVYSNLSQIGVAFAYRGTVYKLDCTERVYQASKGLGQPAAHDLAMHVLTSPDLKGAAIQGYGTKIPNKLFRGDTEPKKNLMHEILEMKVTQHPAILVSWLRKQEPLEFQEASPKDDYWGIGPNKNGDNHLGKLWSGLCAKMKAAIQRGEDIKVRTGFSKEVCDKLGMPYSPEDEFCGNHKITQAEVTRMMSLSATCAPDMIASTLSALEVTGEAIHYEHIIH